MRILIALQYYLPHRTGYTLHVQRVAEGLVARGHAVEVITARHLPQLAAREMVAGVDVTRLPAPLRVSRGAVMPSYPWHAWQRAAGADVVWISTPLLETSLWAMVTALRRTRLVITHHGDLLLPPGAFNRFVQRFTELNYRLAARAADVLVGYSADYVQHSRWLAPYAHKVQVISPPIVIPPPQPAVVAQLRVQWAAHGGPLIGYAGRFAQEKRPDLLLRAAAQLRKAYPQLRVAFAGQHQLDYEDTWQQCQPLVAALGDAALFLGLIEDAQALANYYAACDVLVLPSDTECFALVQVEAMLCGTPVVASDIPGGRVPVTTTGMGRLFAQGDAQELAVALTDVLEDRPRFVRPRADIDAAFNFARTVDAYEAVLAGHTVPTGVQA